MKVIIKKTESSFENFRRQSHAAFFSVLIIFSLGFSAQTHEKYQ